MKKIVISCLGGIAGMVLLSLLAAPAANANNSGCYAHRNQVKPATSVRNCTRQESPQTHIHGTGLGVCPFGTPR